MICMAVSLFLIVSVSGCGNKNSQDNTKVAQPKPIGIVDIAKAAEGHPRYAEYKQLQQAYNTLRQQLELEAQETGRDDQTALSVPDSAAAGLNEALSREFDAKIRAKQDELQGNLDESLAKAKADAAAETDVYTKEIDNVYQPQILSLQLKIRTVQMDKEALAIQQKQLEQLQNERADKLSAKERETAARIETVMSPKKAAAEADLNVYAQQLRAEMDQRAAEQASQITSRVQLPASSNSSTASLEEKHRQLDQRQKEIEALHDLIEKDIKDKTAKIAAERDFDAVFVNVTMNISAVDITNDVIAAFNK